MAVDVDNTLVEKLGYVEFAINSSVNVSTSKLPFELPKDDSLGGKSAILHCR